MSRTSHDLWLTGFAHLQVYSAEHGHVAVAQQHRCPDGYRLGKWVHNQRQRYRTGRLPEDLTALLEGLDGWRWNTTPASPGVGVGPAFTAAWMAQYEALLNYEREHGTLPVLVQGQFGLANWMADQRSQYRAGTLHPERIRLLGKVPGWKFTPGYRGRNGDASLIDQAWLDACKRLQHYAAVTGHPSPAQDYVCPDGFDLGRWVHLQRNSRTKGNLLQAKEKHLNAIPGWVWKVHEHAWEDGFARLRAHLAAGGGIPAGPFRLPDGYPLGSWVVRQRQHHLGTKRSTTQRLRPDRSARLEALPGWTWTFARQDRLSLTGLLDWLEANSLTWTDRWPDPPGEESAAQVRSRVRDLAAKAGSQDRQRLLARGWVDPVTKPTRDEQWSMALADAHDALVQFGSFEEIPRGLRGTRAGLEVRDWMRKQQRRVLSSGRTDPWAVARAEALAALPGWGTASDPDVMALPVEGSRSTPEVRGRRDARRSAQSGAISAAPARVRAMRVSREVLSEETA